MLTTMFAACVTALAQPDGGPVTLATSLQPLIDHFNAGKGTARFVAIVSSTCPACVRKSSAMETKKILRFRTRGIGNQRLSFLSRFNFCGVKASKVEVGEINFLVSLTMDFPTRALP